MKNYNVTVNGVTYTVTVEFDTDKWNYVTDKTSGLLSKIVINRIGYEWTGWFTRPSASINNQDNCAYVYNAITNSGLATLDNDLYTRFNVINDDTKALTIYAGWKAKEYEIDIAYNEILDSTSLAYFKSLDTPYEYTLRKEDIEYIKSLSTKGSAPI